MAHSMAFLISFPMILIKMIEHPYHVHIHKKGERENKTNRYTVCKSAFDTRPKKNDLDRGELANYSGKKPENIL